MNPIFTKIIDKVDAATTAPDDYIHSADGLKYCGKCHTPKEAFYPKELLHGELHRHRSDSSENDADRQRSSRIQQHRHQQDRQYAENAQLPVRAFRRHKETGQAKGI